MGLIDLTELTVNVRLIGQITTEDTHQGNCRWANMTIQSNNRRVRRAIT